MMMMMFVRFGYQLAACVLMRMRFEHLANGHCDLLLIYVYVDNYVFRQACVCTYSGGLILFVDIHGHKTVNCECVAIIDYIS